jgi:3-phenylpropionate/trans-cinnamate dioxygenase ferredoxin reductase subunit
MKAVRDLLDEAGFDRRQYHEESFSFETLTEATPLVDPIELPALNGSAPAFSVSFARSNREITCGTEQHVLDAARQAGVRLPASCTQGMCGTCKVKLVSGQVEMKHNGGIRQREIDQGMVLLCCSKPLSDLVVDK